MLVSYIATMFYITFMVYIYNVYIYIYNKRYLHGGRTTMLYLNYPVPSLNFFCLSFHKVQMRDSEKSSALTRFDCHRACARKCKQT